MPQELQQWTQLLKVQVCCIRDFEFKKCVLQFQNLLLGEGVHILMGATLLQELSEVWEAFEERVVLIFVRQDTTCGHFILNNLDGTICIFMRYGVWCGTVDCRVCQPVYG